MVDEALRRRSAWLGIDPRVGRHDGYGHGSGHHDVPVIALRTDIGVDAGGIAEFPGNLRIDRRGRDHYQGGRDAVEIDLGAAEFGGQRKLGGIGRRGMEREIGALHLGDSARRQGGGVTAAGKVGPAGRSRDARGSGSGDRSNGAEKCSIVAVDAAEARGEQQNPGSQIGRRVDVGIAGAAVGGIDQIRQRGDDGADGVGRQHGVFVVGAAGDGGSRGRAAGGSGGLGAADVDIDYISGLNRGRWNRGRGYGAGDQGTEGHGALGHNINARGIDHAGVGDCVFSHRIDGDAPVVRVADVEVGAIPGERHGRAQGIGCVGSLSDGAGGVGGIGGLADHQVRGDAAGGGNLVEHQNPVVAAIGDEEPVVHRQHEAGKTQRCIAVSRVGGVAVGVRAVGHLTENRSLYRGHGSVGGAGRIRVVGNRADQVRLADGHVGRDDGVGLDAVGGGNGVPDEHAVVAEVGDEDVDAVGADGNRVEHQAGRDAVLLLREVGLDKGGEIGRAEHQIGGRAVAGGDLVEDEHAVVLRVGDVEAAVLNPHSLGAAHGFGVGDIARQRSGFEVGLAHHYIGRRVVAGRNAVPDEHAVVVGVGHHQVNAIAGDGSGQAQGGVGGRHVQGGGGEIRLSQHQRGTADTDRALAGVGQRVGGPGQHAGEILVEEHAVIGGRGSHAIRIGDEQSVGGVGNAAGRAENHIAGIGILGGEGGLPDHQPCGLSRGEVGGA